MDSSAKMKSLFPGVALILLGIIFLLPNFTSLRWQEIWAVFVLAPGIWFFLLFADDRAKVGLLMPASVVTVTGALLLYCSLTGWSSMEDLWPLFIMAPGLGFLLMYLLGKKEPGLLVPAAILLLIGLLFLVRWDFQEYFWPVLLIGIGLFLLLRRGKAARTSGSAPNEPPPTA